MELEVIVGTYDSSIIGYSFDLLSLQDPVRPLFIFFLMFTAYPFYSGFEKEIFWARPCRLCAMCGCWWALFGIRRNRWNNQV